MKELGQFGEIPPLLWLGQSRSKYTLPHAWKEAIECRSTITHNAYIITQDAYLATLVKCAPTSAPSSGREGRSLWLKRRFFSYDSGWQEFLKSAARRSSSDGAARSIH